jgi:hypothetical protein
MFIKDRQAYEVEFVTLDGHTAAVATEASQLRPVGRRDITHTRELSTRTPHLNTPALITAATMLFDEGIRSHRSTAVDRITTDPRLRDQQAAAKKIILW